MFVALHKTLFAMIVGGLTINDKWFIGANSPYVAVKLIAPLFYCPTIGVNHNLLALINCSTSSFRPRRVA